MTAFLITQRKKIINLKLNKMRFTKTSKHTWEASKEGFEYYIDLETFQGEGNMYYLTILENENVVVQGFDFLKLNDAKKYAKQY